ncbi:(deoxy)nucleoside triphosphate pyrophosphohydrolase [Desulfobulbus alkaliphilus]|uniref:(deoxy)nucleoside triphosphate pyrophosphohydrolase n=1 Tax=Desulfobulbus alkaliphilus TaxID=869814 RepID=UPI001964B3B9|nr:(deoxy)nucleoside triphosphate pyrophosphohydrolase [Desulfobulbus alkaliphilus]MBM9535636.1 (deoxy)nucleoside triphosphate pyrophosphohydrolase [Desulfobulbus alkaliphilus]
MKKKIEVVCLVLRDQSGYILATQRPLGKRLALHWEFPGGKVEEIEDPEEALRREISEELSLRIGTLVRLPDVEHTYDFGAIRMIPFLHQCATRPALTLLEHTAALWIHPSAWTELTWAPADIPVLQYLLAAEFSKTT